MKSELYSEVILPLLLWAVEEIGEVADGYADPENEGKGDVAASVVNPEVHDLLGCVTLLLAEVHDPNCRVEMGPSASSKDPLGKIVARITRDVSNNDALLDLIPGILERKMQRDRQKGRDLASAPARTLAALNRLYNVVPRSHALGRPR